MSKRVLTFAVAVWILGLIGGGLSNAASNSTPTDNMGSLTESCPANSTLFLSGVIIYGNERSALIEVGRENSTLKTQLKEGDKICGYTLDRIERDKVVLGYEGGEEILLLKRGSIKVAAKPGNKKRKEATSKPKEDSKKGPTVVKKYAPGEIDLREHQEEVKRGIMEIIRSFPNPAGNIEPEERR